MPLYEYYCRDCGTLLEKLRPAADRDEPVACPNDTTHRPKRLLSTFVALSAGSRSDTRASGLSTGGGCACGGHCSCGGH